MASSSKSTVTAVHFSLMFFVMLSIILGVTTYLFYKDMAEAKATAVASESKAGKVEKINRNRLEEQQALTKLVGHPYQDIGLTDRANENTVLGAMDADIRKYGGILAEPTYSATLQRVRREVDKIEAERNKLTAQVRDQQNELIALKAQYQGMVDQYASARDSAKGDVAKIMQEKEEELRDKVATINRLNSENSNLKTEKEQLIRDHAVQIAEKNEEIGNYIARVDILADELNQIRQVSFEQPDGLLRKVDNSTGLVWINLGSNDNLPVRTNFSVYTKKHYGIGRGQEDIKGAIEVTRIVGPHLAEARILRNSLGDPLAPGDPIYTPLWSPGRQEKFALVGMMDIEPDGYSDRQLIHDLIAGAGGKVQTEVDDKGVRTGSPIDVHTKFLIVGVIKGPDQFIDPVDKKIAQDILQHHKDMVDEARQQGVRVVSLNDFLSWAGYEQSRRTWRPGDPRPDTLKSGAASTAVNETIGDRRSSGQTSGVYGRRGKTQQETSSGQTSKVFGGRRSN